MGITADQWHASTGGHVVYNADCLRVLKELPAGAIDLAVTDPPWHTTDLSFDHKDKDQNYTAIYREIQRVLKPNGWFFCFGTIEVAAEIIASGWRRKFEYVWIKPQIVMKTHNTIRPYYKHELIIACINPALKKMTDLFFAPDALRTPGTPYQTKQGGAALTQFRRETRTIPMDENGFEKIYHRENTGFREGTTVLADKSKSSMAYRERTDHPTQKPISLYETIIRGYCPPAGKVIDPFAGSGACLMAAAKTGRQSISIEINRGYYHNIIDRFRARPPDTNLENY